MAKSYKTMEQLKDSRLLYDKNPPAFGLILLGIVFCALAAALVWSIVTPRIYIVESSGAVVSEARNYI
ncbi:MAG: hypothetical protein LUC27_03805, partial [Lachnospiraceae bacterium]|nr:hypothetical protein [Lachnospiraceae bacterium]